MALQPETKFKVNIVRPALNKISNSYFEKIQQVAIHGTPDFLGCVHGYFVALELKKNSLAKLSALQEYTLKRVESAGGIGLVAYPDNWIQCLRFLTALSEEGVILRDQFDIRPFERRFIRQGIRQS